MGVESSFHQPGTVNEKVLESDLIHRADIVFIIKCNSSAILNTILRSLSVNYGSVYYLPLHLKTGDGDLPPITEPALLTRCA